MAVHNEEAVLPAKLASLAQQAYAGPLLFLIGSDCSTDATNDILQQWQMKDARFRPTLFTSRQGKPGIINQLATIAGVANSPEAVLVITDASVLLQPATIGALVHPMQEDPRIGVVDATMVQVGGQAAGIGVAESRYIHREVAVKRAESRRWGTMIGPFGGCWAIKAAAYTPVPGNYLVDDFFLCMAAYEQGYRGVSSENAVVYEAVGQHLRDEFHRKVRISSGNWQNLVRFRNLWWVPTKNALAFAFFSHKVLRWWTPFFILIGSTCVLLLIITLGNHWASTSLAILLVLPGILVLTDLFLEPLGLHLRPLRALRYFLAMNLALLVGFYRYLTGIKSNVWQPSKRH